MSWENALYTFANDCMATSREKWDAGQKGVAWGYTIPARLAYLCDMIINIVILPFAILAVTFGALHALCTWNRQSKHFQSTRTELMERANHFFLSLFGSIISPALAHKFRDANIAPYIVALRITVISAGALYYAFFR